MGQVCEKTKSCGHKLSMASSSGCMSSSASPSWPLLLADAAAAAAAAASRFLCAEMYSSAWNTRL